MSAALRVHSNNEDEEDGDDVVGDVSIRDALPWVIVGKGGGRVPRRMQTEVGLPLPPASAMAATSSSQPCYANLATTSAATAAASKKKKPAASPPSAGAVQRDYENFR